MKSNKDYMKELRKNRILRGECGRCGKKNENSEYKTCIDCRQYLITYRKKGPYRKENTTYIYSRMINTEKITRMLFFNTITERQISIKSLSKETGVSTRTIHNVLYSTRSCNKRTKEKINTFFDKELI